MTVKIHTFPNGFQFIYEKSKNKLPVSSVQVFCDLGSIYETDTTRGVSHFIEHMCFKGTKEVPYSKDIFRQYDQVGAYLNASTYKRHTNYIIKCQDSFLENLIHVMSDMMLNSIFDKKEFDKEYKVVLEENSKSDNDYESLLVDIVDENVYKGTRYQYAVDCSEYHKKNHLDYAEVMRIYNLFYQPNNMIFSIVTNASYDHILRILKKSHFVSKTRHAIPSNPMVSLEEIKSVAYIPAVPQIGPQYIIRKVPDSSVTYLAVTFRTCTQYSTDKHILTILKKIIGGFFSSRLFMVLREENGLTYSSYVYSDNKEMLGDFTIISICQSTKLLKNGAHKKGVLPLIIEMLNDLIQNGITESELQVTKNYMKGKMFMKMEDNAAKAVHNAKYLLLYKDKEVFVPYEKIFETYYEPVTREQVNSIIRKYLKKENMTVTVVGTNVPKENAIKKVSEVLCL
jgi:predicted Zn-dependent peptidase